MSLERCESGYGKALDGEEFENNALLNQFQREAVKNLDAHAQSFTINHMKLFMYNTIIK